MEVFDPARQIRILELEAGNADSPLSTSFKVLTIDPFTSSKSYYFEAISYAWEGQPATQDLVVDRKPLKVSKIVIQILKDLRYADQPRRLWIDAICIDQENDAEKHAQVALMTSVYSNAEAVIIWLRTDGLENAADGIHTAVAWLESGFDKDSILKSYHPALLRKTLMSWFRAWHPDLKCSSPFHDITELDWFRRIWVVQEAVMARCLLVHLGNRSLPWERFASAVLQFLSNMEIPEATTSSLEDCYKFACQWTYSDGTKMTLSMINLVLTLRKWLPETDVYVCPSELATICRDRMATDPRDKVYGLMGLFGFMGNPGSNPSSLEIDYTCSTEEVYAKFTTWCIQQEGTLDVLAQQECEINPHYRGFPTWVVNWNDRRSDVTRTASLASKLSQENRLNPNHRPDIKRHGRLLRVRGYVLDTISNINPLVMFKPGHGDNTERLQEWQNQISRTNNIHIKAFFYGEGTPTLETLQKRYDQTIENQSVISHLWRDGERLSTPKSPEYASLILTDNGILVFSYHHFVKYPPTKLCGLYGGRGLFVLQESEPPSIHRLITGSCFVDGLENGQGVEIAMNLGLPEEEFWIS
jgi:hypothetical protein